MRFFAVFASEDKIIAVEESELGCFEPRENTFFLKMVQVENMEPRILKRPIER